jgi:hypothetical protein
MKRERHALWVVECVNRSRSDPLNAVLEMISAKRCQ